MSDVLLYGANGYTASLIIPLAQHYGLSLLLAGRSADKIAPIAAEHGLPHVAFDLLDAAACDAALAQVRLVLHCAGPFSATAKPMMAACLRQKKHYLDITGEIEVFELAQSFGAAAQAAGILVMSGVGFDVVPTDCLAAYLKAKLPSATQLKLAFANVGGALSHGTAKTMLQNLGQPGAVRRDGRIVPVPPGYKTAYIDFGVKTLFTMSIPWGDVSTAYHTTGIPNVEVYTAVSPKSYKWVRRQRYLGWLLKRAFVRRFFLKKIEQRPAGPSAEKRAKARSYVWGEVRDGAGQGHQALLECPDGYTLTAKAALLIAQKVLAGQYRAGSFTPAGLFGADLVLDIEGVSRKDV